MIDSVRSASHDVKLLGGSILVLICESFDSQIVDKLPIP